ncbi:MAG TPA: plastocyanin/azurin family copper-binding protein [Solirubrobacteraceae bacterium]|jgi:plastocyanin
MKKLAAAAVVLAAFIATAVPSTAATTVKLGDDFFKPKSLTVKSGTTVRWRWTGDDPHNVTVTKGPVKFHSGTKRSGTYSKKLRRGGTYKIVCTIHPGMAMTLKVR